MKKKDKFHSKWKRTYLVQLNGDSPQQNFHNNQIKFRLGHRVPVYIGKTTTENKRKVKQLLA
jgi:hypothetical protein